MRRPSDSLRLPHPRGRSALALLALCALAAAARAQQETTESHDDGALRCRYQVDAAGQKHGRFEQFFASGKPWIEATYASGELHGAYRELDEDGTREFTARYVRGVLDGAAKVVVARNVVSKQTWRHGTLAKLDGIEAFPIARDELIAALASIEQVAQNGGIEPDGREARQAAALRRLAAYRFLCRVPHDGLELVPEWNERCTAAAEVCAANGDLSHFPPQPPGFDEARYRLGQEGARSSNITSGGGMIQSVDGFMDDSDDSNIARVGHRRWCVNPQLKKTGFGECDGYAAMWSFDSSGKGAKGLDAVMYPPRGFVPVDYFGARHAWSIALLRGSQPKLDELAITVHELDEHYVERGQALPLDWKGIADAGQGTSACIVFRAVGIVVEPGRRYRARVSTDGGKSNVLDYVVEFCRAVRPVQAVDEAGFVEAR